MKRHLKKSIKAKLNAVIATACFIIALGLFIIMCYEGTNATDIALCALNIITGCYATYTASQM